MIRWWRFSLLLTLTACSHTMLHRDAAFDCGIPRLSAQPIGGRVEIARSLAADLQKQLPAGRPVEAGCWEQLPNGRLEGSFALSDGGNSRNVTVFVFEYRNDRWILTDTRHELQQWETLKAPG